MKEIFLKEAAHSELLNTLLNEPAGAHDVAAAMPLLADPWTAFLDGITVGHLFALLDVAGAPPRARSGGIM